jgi:hypothetical protein
VPALELVVGFRVVARPDALDGARWEGDDVDVIRIAPDEAFGIGASGVEVDDPDAIVEPETGFGVALLDADDQFGVVDHIEWVLSEEPGVIAQGKVAGVPAQIRTGDPASMPLDEPALLITNNAYANELERRLGWR